MNKKIAVSLSTYTALLFISVIEGWRSTYLVDLILIDVPDSVEAFIRFWLICTGTEYLANPDDMEVLALLLYWLIATLLFGFGLVGLKRWVSRYCAARITREPIPRLPAFVTLVMFLLGLVVSCDLGWYLSLLFTRYRFDMPGLVKAVIRFYGSVTGQGAGSDRDDDLSYFAADLYWAIATLCVGALLILCCISARRILHRKTS
jgi:hypothetical protein